jgi:hypothetical protein
MKKNVTYLAPGIDLVLTFTKKISATETKKIQVIASKNTPLETILLFHSSTFPAPRNMSRVHANLTACVMNIISWEAIYSLYAFATLLDRRSLKIELPDCLAKQQQGAALEKYAKRGFKIIDQPEWEERAGLREQTAFQERLRYVGDKYTLVLPLPLLKMEVGDKPLPVAHDCLSSHSWTLKLPETSSAYNSFSIYRSPALKWTYTLSDEEARRVLARDHITRAEVHERTKPTVFKW